MLALCPRHRAGEHFLSAHRVDRRSGRLDSGGAVQRLRSATITLFADAWHDFDNPAGRLRVRRDVPNGVHAGGVTVGPNPKARAEAMAQIDRLLHARHLVRGQSAAD